MGKKARKGELYHIALNALTRALLFQKKNLNLKKDRILQSNSTEVLLKIAKMKYKIGKLTEALQILEHDDIQNLLIDSYKLQIKVDESIEEKLNDRLNSKEKEEWIEKVVKLEVTTEMLEVLEVFIERFKTLKYEPEDTNEMEMNRNLLK